MTILWLRHGETALNVARVMQPPDTPLSARGLQQAALAAPRLQSLRPAAILSSDMPRARQTAEAVAALTGLPVQIEPLLQERNFGDWRGRAHASFDFDPVTSAETPPGGESVPVFLARVAQAWARIVAHRAALDGPLLVVSHGLVIRAALEHHTGIESRPALPQRLANTALSIVDALPPHRLHLANCTRHLAGVADDDGQSLSGG